jgi:hypothetical protein
VESNYGLGVHQDSIQESLWSPYARKKVGGIRIPVKWFVHWQVRGLHVQFHKKLSSYSVICLCIVQHATLREVPNPGSKFNQLDHDNSMRSRNFFRWSKDGLFFFPKIAGFFS